MIERSGFLLTSGPDNSEPWLELIKIDEHGLGFQHIETDESYSENAVPRGEYLVFNCELFIPYDYEKEKELRFLGSTSYESYIQMAKPKRCTSVSNPKKIETSSYNPTTLILSTKTCEDERYWRLSGYANDRRINNLNEVVSGTYLTSDSELAHISSGFGAVGRYALPNPFPSVYAYSVIPKRGLDIKLGTVRPAFGQAGGGVEAVIRQSSGEHSVSNHKRVLPAW